MAVRIKYELAGRMTIPPELLGNLVVALLYTLLGEGGRHLSSTQQRSLLLTNEGGWPGHIIMQILPAPQLSTVLKLSDFTDNNCTQKLSEQGR